jgi:hypothetical protein
MGICLNMNYISEEKRLWGVLKLSKRERETERERERERDFKRGRGR